MKTKTILFVADASSIHTIKWVNYFVERNYDVHLATFASINNTQCSNIYFLSKKNISVKGGNYHYLFSIIKLSKIIKSLRPRIINAHYSYSVGLVALLAKKMAKIDSNFSIVCHGSDVLAPPKPIIFDMVNRYVLHNSDKIFVVSDQIKDKLVNFGIDLNRVFVGQYGINRETKVCTKDIDILSNRNYTPNSRIEFLLDALKDFESKGLNIVFVLPHIDDNKLQEFKKDYPFIEFYRQVPYDEMMNMVSRTKIYISATKSDGTSLSLMEAMDRGAVPIVSNIVSNRSWILDSVNGYLFDTKEQLQASLKKVLPMETKDLIFINKKLIQEKCNYKTQMQKIEEFLCK